MQICCSCILSRGISLGRFFRDAQIWVRHLYEYMCKSFLVLGKV